MQRSADTMKQSFDAIILGAGAAGLMCAMEAGKRGRRVALLERSERVGKKILISGGGRCNFTNIHCKPENFLSANPHFAKSALARYTPADIIALVQKHGIPYHEKTLGQLFCDRSARDVVAMLLEECAAVGVEIVVNADVRSVQRTDEFIVKCEDAIFAAPVLVVATGGLSIPKMGATGFGYDLARQFGHTIRDCRPALVPLVFGESEASQLCDLTGISAEVVASIDRQRFREKMLITHRGLSGPAILQISSYWNGAQPVAIDLAPGKNVIDGAKVSPATRNAGVLKSALRQVLSQRLSDRLMAMHPPAGWSNQALDAWEAWLHRWEFVPAGTEGYEKAEVTAGGVDTDKLSAKTMESKLVPGLYFIGEVVDVTGHLGGFNFQWAWASGAAAGRAL